MSRAYIDADDLAYVMAVKQNLRALLLRRGVTLDDLSDVTGIPEPSLRRWLSLSTTTFMPLTAARRICLHLDIEIADMLMPLDTQGSEPLLHAFLALPPNLAEVAIRYAYAMANACGNPVQPPPDFE